MLACELGASESHTALTAGSPIPGAPHTPGSAQGGPWGPGTASSLGQMWDRRGTAGSSLLFGFVLQNVVFEVQEDLAAGTSSHKQKQLNKAGIFFFFRREIGHWVLWKGLFKDNFLQRSSGTPNIHRDILLRTRLSIKKNSLNKNAGLLPCSALLLGERWTGNCQQWHGGSCQEGARKQKTLYCVRKPDIYTPRYILNSCKPFP